jgi:uncharacterized protein YjgD (DUF1641 family)
MGGHEVMIQKLMQNKEFRAFVSNPKVQELFKDPEFQAIAKTKDFSKIMTHPKLMSLMRDPELALLMTKLNPKDFLGMR